jgi:hypothetical protein
VSKSRSLKKAAPPKTATTMLRIAGVERHQGDRSGGDDDDDGGDAGPLPLYVRFKDLLQARIVLNWRHLKLLQDKYDFPYGVLLGPNSRAWTDTEIKAWIKSRPSARKIVPETAHRPRRQQLIESSGATATE